MNHDIPPPFKLSKPSQLDRKYSLSVVQNPIRARCCGFGEKDRRPIDPPPILQLTAKNSFGEAIDLKPEDSVLFLVQCELYNEDMTENRTLVYTPWSTNQQQHNDNVVLSNTKPEYVRNLIGSSVSNAYHLYNEENKLGTYFIFQDLSVRTEGIFTLKFVFIDLAFGEPLRKTTQIQQTVFSSTFQVYPAKKFPGLTESTSLSRCFSKQGIKIPIRNDSPYKRISNAVYSQDHPSFIRHTKVGGITPSNAYPSHYLPSVSTSVHGTPSATPIKSDVSSPSSSTTRSDHHLPKIESVYHTSDCNNHNSSTLTLNNNTATPDHSRREFKHSDTNYSKESNGSNNSDANSASNSHNSTNSSRTPKYKRISISDVLSPD